MVRGVGVIEIEPTIVIEIAEVRSHASLFHTVFVEGNAGEDARFLELSTRIASITLLSPDRVAHTARFWR